MPFLEFSTNLIYFFDSSILKLDSFVLAAMVTPICYIITNAMIASKSSFDYTITL